MNVSIVMPIFNPDKNLLKKIISSVKKQKFNGKFELIKVDKNLGLAESMNYGIKRAKYPIVVTLHQDCIPSSNNWLNKLIEPLNKREIVASVSKVELPKELWDKFDFISKILSVKEQKIITPLIDEKACAYKKDILLNVGLFNYKEFKTAGEDFDMYIKLKEKGKIAYPNTKIIHYHYFNWKKRLKKELQLANGFGALFRIYQTKMPKWSLGLLKSIPILGYPLFLFSINPNKLKSLVFPAVLLYVFVNLIYSYGFWKGFLNKRQTI